MSAIEGQGVHAVEAIAGGEVVAVKGGHIVDGSAVAGLPDAIRNSAFQIAADCFLAALTCDEYNGVMMRVNHSCEPNVGMGGNVLLVSMRDIAAGEELTIDYALFLGDPGFAMECRRGTAACRGVVKGTDWMRTDFLRASRLHPLIEAEARPQFLINKYEQGVFASMKAVEVRVRKLAGFGEDVIGVDLMNKAFGSTGPLTDPSAAKGEQQATHMLFAGAYGVLRNPAGHREVDYGDLSEAAEAIQVASLLMRILDRVEDRLLPGVRSASNFSG